MNFLNVFYWNGSQEPLVHAVGNLLWDCQYAVSNLLVIILSGSKLIIGSSLTGLQEVS